MARFGKRNKIKVDPLSYNFALIGESGAGKSTVIKEYCEKLAGDEGYLFLEIGKEDGHDAINGIIYETVEDWDKLTEVVDDIIENRTTDYKDLKVVVFDTLDELFAIAEPEVLRMHNRENPTKTTKSINSAFGGFQAGQDKAIEIVLDILWSLKKVGISFIVIGHTKTRNVTDAVTGEDYMQLTTNLPQKYFNAIKTKVHILGTLSIDREIAKEKTGKKNIVTKKDIEKGVVKAETRKITFRDDNFVIDSKSRFADIVESIPLDSDALIKAITDAIKVELAKDGTSFEDATVEQAKANETEFKRLAQQEVENKKADELATVLEEIKTCVAKHKTNPENLGKIMEKANELNYANPMAIDNIEDAKALIAYMNTLK